MDNRLKSCNRVTMTASKYHPQSKPELHRPLAPSVTANAVPAPFGKGAFLRPVSFHCAIPGFIRLSIDSVGRRQSQNPQTQTGAEVETPHPSQSEGSIPVGSTRGILKGGTIRAGASCSPLKPASLHTFLPEQESKAPLASARSVSGINFPR